MVDNQIFPEKSASDLGWLRQNVGFPEVSVI